MGDFGDAKFSKGGFGGTHERGGSEGGPQKEPTGGIIGQKAKRSFLSGKKTQLSAPQPMSVGSEGQQIF